MKIPAEYNELKKLGRTHLADDRVTDCIEAIHARVREQLSSVGRIELVSKVAGKNYFAFEFGKSLSRAVNAALYLDEDRIVSEVLSALRGNRLAEISPEDITRAYYTLALSFCCTVDLAKRGDQKTPGTYFEYLIGHTFATLLGVTPRRQIEVLNLDRKAVLPTDFIFDLGPDRAKFHLPVKTSTRERVIQVWAHQRVLDGVYGTDRFSGILVCIGENKRDASRKEVVEICLPDQWRVYQMFISRISRVYYLDPPEAYEKLERGFPVINVRQFGRLPHEIGELTA